MLPRHVVRMMGGDGWIKSHAANAGAQTERRSPAQTVVVLSASKASGHRPSPTTAVISIRGVRDAEIPLSTRYRAVLRLAFDDISAFADHSTDDASISKEQAQSVAAFVRTHADADTLLIHCAAGVSRSRSMAAAICDVRGLPYQWTVVNDDVYRRVRDAMLESMAAGIADDADSSGRRHRGIP